MSVQQSQLQCGHRGGFLGLTPGPARASWTNHWPSDASGHSWLWHCSSFLPSHLLVYSFQCLPGLPSFLKGNQRISLDVSEGIPDSFLQSCRTDLSIQVSTSYERRWNNNRLKESARSPAEMVMNRIVTFLRLQRHRWTYLGVYHAGFWLNCLVWGFLGFYSEIVLDHFWISVVR